MELPKKYDNIIATTAKEYNFDLMLLHAVVLTESSYNPYKIKYEVNYCWLYNIPQLSSDCYCDSVTMKSMQMTSWGLCQIMGATAYSLGFKGWCTYLIDPEENLKWSVAYLKSLIVKQGLKDPLDIYAAYNAGSVRKVDGHYVNATAVNNFKKNLVLVTGDKS